LINVPGYEILEVLGRGGMGVVYKARQVGLNRVVALKMVLSGVHAGKKELARFRTEAVAVARLRHANIVQVHEIGEHEGRPFFSLEFIEGGSLAAKLARTTLQPGQAAQLVETLARAVHSAHERGIVHRDLKPGNILLLADGTPKITDFGLAKRLEGEAGTTESGAVVGTPSYMAPEQAGGHTHQIGAPADIYALGSILYETLTGRPPFKADSPLDTCLQVLQEEPLPPSRLQRKVPRDLEIICLKCLQKDRGKRYGSALELAEDLRRFLDDEPILARPTPLWERGRRWVKHRPALAASIALLILCGIGILLWNWQARRQRAHAAAQCVDEGLQLLQRAASGRSPRQSGREYEAAMQAFTRALTLESGNEAARAGLGDLYLQRCRDAVASRDYGVVQGLLLHLRELNTQGKYEHEIADYERRAFGTGMWSVETQPPGCRVSLVRLDQNFQPEQPEEVGTSPLPARDIPMGNYLVLLSHPGYAEVRYPMQIERNENESVNVTLVLTEKIPPKMVYVPGGEFRFGDPQEGTERKVFVKSFFIDKTEVTGAEYENFVQATGARPPEAWSRAADQAAPNSRARDEAIPKVCPPALRDQAVWNVSWYDAVEYARWAGKRLPTEEEWEKAARGVDGRRYPWGEHFERRRCNCRLSQGRKHLEVGQFPRGASPYGCLDMAGNVWEWTLGREEPYSPFRVMRGGAGYSTSDDLLAFRRQAAPPGGSSMGALNLTGLRCVKSLEPEKPMKVADLMEYGTDWSQAAETYWRLQRYNLVRDCVGNVLLLNPRSVAGNYWLAACLEQEGKLAEALAALKIVYCQQPNFRFTQRNIRQYMQQLGPKGSLRHRRQLGSCLASVGLGTIPSLCALALPPDPPLKVDVSFMQVPRLLQSANQALQQKMHSDAETHLRKVLQIDPENLRAHGLLGQVCEATGRREEAMKHYEQRMQASRTALKEEPGDAELCNDFAWFLAERHLSLDEGVTLARRAMQLEPETPAIIDTLAELLFQKNQITEAIALERRAAELDPEEAQYPKQLKKFESHLAATK
jgi:formylglycine-generating enzyme required for sulfatase activity/Tfp pilus assembly protein PilF